MAFRECCNKETKKMSSDNKKSQKKLSLEKKIIRLLTKTPQFLPDIFRELKARKKKDYKIIQKAVKNLEQKRYIVSDKKGMFSVVSFQGKIRGKILMSSRGYGFVEKENNTGDCDIFIPAKFINGALDGDTVEVRIIKEDPNIRKRAGKGPVGIVDKIVERKKTSFVGELIVKRKGFYLRPLNRKIPDDIPIIDGDFEHLKRGDWLKAEIIYSGKGKISCKFIKKIGKVGNLEDDIDAIVAEYNLQPPYTEKLKDYAESIEPLKIKREDLTDLFCVTIDPHDAKDFDDAVSVNSGENENEVILGVHIADVSAWITHGSRLDKEAWKRSFTAYIPGRTLPMLPENLTAEISLRSDRDYCHAHSVLITVNQFSGKIIKYRRVHSKIKISNRLTFKEVEKYIRDGNNSEWSRELSEHIRIMCNLYRKMREYREAEEKFLNLETTETRVLRDEKGEITGLEKKKQGEADCLIEEFMLAANSVVAKEFVNRKLPGIYRVHPEPDASKLEEFSSFINKVFNLSTGDLTLGRKNCQKFLKSIKGTKYEEIITSFFLRAMNRALYTEKPALHYGLGKGLYLHFTSPIRRYPDLLVHQQLLLKEYNKELIDSENVKKIASECTEQEKNNDEAFFAANDRLKLHYLQSLLSKNEIELYEGIVSTVNAGGMLVDIPAIGLSSYIPVENIGGSYSKRYGRLVSERRGTEYKPGDFIYLQLEKIDFIKGTAIFNPVQY
ncbi:MAG: RNB domain-containing ribonuclease [Victivallales bacterium]|nr:RNB domain-containing ribonuclease [Victivallales bacterium]